MSVYRLTIPGWLPARLNDLVGVGVSRRYRLKWADAEQLGRARLALGLERATRQTRRRLSLEITLGPGMKRGDGDNWWKSCLDGAKRAGLIYDDGPRWCEQGSLTFLRGAEPGTTVILECLPGADA